MKTIEFTQLREKTGMPVHCQALDTSGKQIVIICQGGRLFYSYGTFVAAWLNGHLYLTEFHDYSKTTCKYTNQFTNLNTNERREAINKEEATLIINY